MLLYVQPNDMAKRHPCEITRTFTKLAERRSYVDYDWRAPALGAHGIGGADIQCNELRLQRPVRVRQAGARVTKRSSVSIPVSIRLRHRCSALPLRPPTWVWPARVVARVNSCLISYSLNA